MSVLFLFFDPILCTPLDFTKTPSYNDSAPKAGPESEFQGSLHLSISLGGMTLILFIVYHVRSFGYVLSDSWYFSTDFLMWLVMLLTSVVWTVIIVLSSEVWGSSEEAYCRRGFGWACLGRMAFIPWIQLWTGLWWLVMYGLFKWKPYWFLEEDNGHDRVIRGSPTRNVEIAKWFLYATLMIVLAFPIVSTFRSTYYTLAFLTVIAFLIFLHGAFETNPPLEGPHSCRLDDCRVPLRGPLPHHCVVYLLPSKNSMQNLKRGSPCIGAKVGLKVLDEHVELDRRIQELEPCFATWSLETCRDAIRAVTFHRMGKISVGGQEDQLKALDDWMALRSDDAAERRADAETPFDSRVASKVIKQFGREVVMALLVWDTLLFEWRHKLSKSPSYHYRRQFVTSISATAVEKILPMGMPVQPSSDKEPVLDKIQARNDIQFKDQASLNGYRAFLSAVTYSCQVLCQEPSDASRMILQDTLENMIRDFGRRTPCPAKSRALPNDKDIFLSWEDYCGRLWSRCWELDRSTFGALYLCMSAWHADVGDTAELEESQRLFPVRSLEVGGDGAGYASAWRMRWRHLWHVAIICQLVVMLPTVISKFFAVATFII